MRRVWSCNEWDQLEEVVVGNPAGARYPMPDQSTQLVMFPDHCLDSLPRGAFPKRVIEETEEDLHQFIDLLESQGVKVQRPRCWDHSASFGTVHWKAHGYHNYCPRDIMTVVADQIIESPNVVRSRLFEAFSYRELLMEYMQSGAKWYSAPKPLLLDSLYDVGHSTWPMPHNHEPVFDAANILRLGRDVLYLVSASGNEVGGKWLQAILGDGFRVHLVENVYAGSHIDSTFVALRPGLILCNPARVNDSNMPKVLRQWDRIYSPPMVTTKMQEQDCIGSAWIDMNIFSIAPDLVVVDCDQLPLIRLLERFGVQTARLKLRHSRLLGGGFHCVTLDIRRNGALETYFK